MFSVSAVALLVMLIIPEGIGTRRCECIGTDRRPIGRLLGLVEVRAVSPHCNRVEIIGTIKTTGEKVCLDPNLIYVKRVLERKAAEARRVEVTTPL